MLHNTLKIVTDTSPTFQFVSIDHRRPVLGEKLLNHLNLDIPSTFLTILDSSRYTNNNNYPKTVNISSEMVKKHFSTFAGIQEMMLKAYPIPRSIEYNNTMDRYNGIIPYDHSRLPLPIARSPYNNNEYQRYINASDVLPPVGFPSKHSYIATQAPLPTTIGDMWSMVWNHHVELIVMLTKVEDKKAIAYWPIGDNIIAAAKDAINATPSLRGSSSTVTESESLPGFYQIVDEGRLKITIQNTVPHSEFDVRQLLIQDLSNPDDPSGKKPCNQRNVNLIQYKTWPDGGVPLRASFLHFLMVYRLLRSHMRFSRSPIVVHCLAGVGRTGTFIAIDMMLDYIASEMLARRIPSLAKVAEVVAALRTCRQRLVDRPGQYAWIYNFLQYAYWNPYRERIGLPRFFHENYDGFK